jgi:hypothetical protein
VTGTAATRTFTLSIPPGVVAPATFALTAVATDAAGNTSAPAARTIVAPDTVPPVVTSLVSAGGGLRVVPGQGVSVHAVATDNVAVVAIDFTVDGAASAGGTVAIAVPAASASADFGFGVPANAAASASVNVHARARDAMGNASAEVTLVLTVGDTTPPAVTITSPASGGFVRPGDAIAVLVSASDDGALASVGLDATGATPSSQTQAIAPPAAQASASFTVNVTASAAPGSAVTLVASAVDLAGNQASTPAVVLTVTATGAVVSGLVTINGQAVTTQDVDVSVTDATGTTVTATTDGAGRYQASGLAGGAIAAVAVQRVTGLRGTSAGVVVADGSLTLDIALRASGRVIGRVLAALSTQPVPGAQVTVSPPPLAGPATVTTDAGGAFAFDPMPLGGFTLDALVPASGDRARAQDSLSVSGETRAIDLQLVGFGTVVVAVADTSSVPVSGVNVVLTSQTIFGGTQNGATSAAGTVTFTSVFAGPFGVVATDPVTQLAAQGSGTVAAGATARVALSLPAAGTIQGTVFGPDGTSPATGTAVQLAGPAARRTIVGGDGRFAFATVPTGVYALEAFDAQSRLRAQALQVDLAQNRGAVTQDLTLVGLGTVTGVVRNPPAGPGPGAPAGNVAVLLQCDAGPFGGTFGATSDAATGVYVVAGVPVGAFRASASVPAQRLLGEATGQVLADGTTVTADIQLQDDGITLPVTRHDANAFPFDIQPDGSVANGMNDVFGGDFVQHTRGLLLDVVSGGTPQRFAPAGTLGTASQEGREIAVEESGVAGLDVVRRVFVPQTGYFARWIEMLSNPTSATITVDVRVTTNLAANQPPTAVVATSSGDATLAAGGPSADRWVVVDDAQDGDPFVLGGLPAVGFAFSGPGGALALGAAALVPINANGPQALTYEWDAVAVPPGGTVALLHFVTQQTSRAAAQASIARLAALPPEALEGLAPADIAAIANFAVPAGAVSGLAPLPPVDAAVSGRVVAGDGVTPVPDATVTFQSQSIFYGRKQQLTADAAGNYLVRGRFGELGSPVAVPLDAFTLAARHPLTQVLATPVAGAFSGTFTGDVALGRAQPGASSALQSFPAANAIDGDLSTFWITASGDNAASGAAPFIEVTLPADATVTAVGLRSLNGVLATEIELFDALGNLLFAAPAVPDANGSADLAVPSQGSVRRARVAITRDQGFDELAELEVVGSIASAAGDARADVVFSNTGTITGTVRRPGGAPAGAGTVQVSGESPSFVPTAVSIDPATGSFTLTGVPPGTFEVTASVTNPLGSSLVGVAIATVAAGQTTQADVMLVATGAVSGTVRTAGGASAVGVAVELTEAGDVWSTSTDGSGRYTISDVPVGPAIVAATEPTTQVPTSAPVAIVAGQTAQQDLVLTGVGSLEVDVKLPGGANAPQGLLVTLQDASLVSQGSRQTDASGHAVFPGVAAGPFTASCARPANQSATGTASGIMPASGSIAPVTLVLPAFATVRASVLDAGGNPVSGANVSLSGAFFSSGSGVTGAGGTVDLPNVAEGPFFVIATVNNPFAGSAAGAVAPADDGGIVPITVLAAVTGTVQGTVTAGDGVTVFRGASVTVFDAASGRGLAFLTAGPAGLYAARGVRAGAAGVRVRARAGFGPSAPFAETTLALSPGGTVTANLAVPAGIVQGTVFFHDGTTRSNTPAVSAQQGSNSFTGTADARGNYLLVGPQAGPFTLTVTDGPSTATPFTASFSGSVASVATPVTLDVILPPLGTVAGTVSDAQGRPAPFADVMVDSSGAPGFLWQLSTDFSGRYSVPRVPLGEIAVQAQDPSVPQGSPPVFGSERARLVADGTTATVNVVLPGRATVEGHVFAADGVTAVGGASVTVSNRDSFGAIGFYEASVTADGAGFYAVAGVPTGTVEVVAVDPATQDAGLTLATLAAAVTASVDVVIGGAARPTYDLDGADGFRYDVQGDGSLFSGGEVSGAVKEAYQQAYLLSVETRAFPSLFEVALEAGTRQAALSPVELSGLRVRRKVFAPPGGGFARFLEVLENPGADPWSATVAIDGTLGAGPATRIVRAPTATADAYAVTDGALGGPAATPALAYVFGGAGAAVPVGAASFTDGVDAFHYDWSVTVPPGATVILMHFAVQRAPGDAAGAEAQAQALAGLTDPSALAGLSAEERAEVANFAVPP